MQHSPVIALLSDFGNRDGYVAAMKGVILKRVPNAIFVDISHDIPPQDVQTGAAILADVLPYLPDSCCVLAVVDPGVGTTRRAIAIATQENDKHLIGPDNGLLWQAVAGQPRAMHEITSPKHQLTPVSKTFHGRDIFAPAAAHIAAGGRLVDLGLRISELVKLPEHPLVIEANAVHGTVERADIFGNLLTNIPSSALPSLSNQQLSIDVGGGRPLIPMLETYGDAIVGALCACIGSNDKIEIAQRDGSAAQTLGYNRQQSFPISLRW